MKMGLQRQCPARLNHDAFHLIAVAAVERLCVGPPVAFEMFDDAFDRLGAIIAFWV